MRKQTKDKAKASGLSEKALIDAVEQKPGVLQARMIALKQVVTAAWVRLKCQYGCDGYGQCLVCPPFTPDAEQMRKVLDSYQRGLLLHFAPEAETKAVVAELEREFFLAGAWKTFGLGAGPCYFCKRCAVEKGTCRHPERARPSMEACGINVYSTTVKKFGFPIEVVRTPGQCPNYYGLILID